MRSCTYPSSRHVIVSGLALSSKPINYMFLLSYPAWLPPSTVESLTQLFFENLYVTNLLLAPCPLMQLYSCAALSGIVIDVGREGTDVSVICETQIQYGACVRSAVGEKDCDRYLTSVLLAANPALPQQLAGEGRIPLEGIDLERAVTSIIHALKEGEHIRYIPAGATGAGVVEEEEEGITDVAKAIASGKANKLLAGQTSDGGIVALDNDNLAVPNSLDPNLSPVIIGLERHRYADPLFDPSVLAGVHGCESKSYGLGLPELCNSAAGRVLDLERRIQVWENVVFTGGLARVKGIYTPSGIITSLHEGTDCSMILLSLPYRSRSQSGAYDATLRARPFA